MNKKVIYLLSTIFLTASLFTGCGTVSDDEFNALKGAAGERFDFLESQIKICRDKIIDLQTELENVRIISGIKSTPLVSSEELKFSSIRVAAINAKDFEESVVVPADSTFNVVVDTINVSEKELAQYICQGYLTYYSGENYLDRQVTDVRFDIMPKSVRKNISLDGFESKGADVKHVLTIVLKDIYSNEIVKFEKEIFVQ